MSPSSVVELTASSSAFVQDSSFWVVVLMTLWLYLSGFLANTFAMMWGKWLPKTGYGPWPIDGGKVWKDGERLLGDGKTWNGLIGGSLTSGLLCMLISISMGMPESYTDMESGIFVHPLTGYEDTWWNVGGLEVSAFLLGTMLGFFCLLGDMTGSFFKRRRGLKREGNVSSKAPILDTLPFAIMLFILGQLCLGSALLSSTALLPAMVVLIIATPILHRSFNLIGYAIGWKDVPY